MMTRIVNIFLLIILAILFSPNFIRAETSLDVYMNDFYSKSNKARQILKENEIILKKGSRTQVCSRQREAAKLGLSANDSLIKAFKIGGKEVPMEAIKATQKKWESLLNEC